jgi:ABC-2 type transport system ATP-binding protein
VSEPVLTARSLRVRYGRRLALDDVSFAIEGGAIGLLGPNGAGKSTLIRVLLGFLRPEAGEVTVLGRRVADDPLGARQKLGFVPEVDCHIPGMSAVGYVAYCGMLSGMPRADAIQRAHEMLYFVGLGEERYRPLEEYSTGMKQRIKIAQALVHDPKLLLLDEPTNGMDPHGRREVLDLIRDLAGRKGIHVLLSSHLLPDVEYACRSVVMLHQGRIVGQGGIEELVSRHGSHFRVKLKGDRNSFCDALSRRGGRLLSADQDRLEVVLGDGTGPSAIFAAARETGAQVRGLSPSRDSLEEIFARAVGREA